MKFLLLLVASTSLVINVSANSSGTGSCAAGIACVGGTHLNYGPTSSPLREGAAGTLPEALVTVSLNGVTLTPGTTATFVSGVDLAWVVTSTGAVPYKGIFVRVQAGTDNVFTLTGDGSGLSLSPLCDALTDNVIGVTQNNAGTKLTNSGVMNFSGTGTVSMDVTLVFDNTLTSVYASSNFPLTIGGAPVAPTPVAPVPAVGSPTGSPAGVPTAPTGTSAPAAAPVPSSTTAAPVAAPVPSAPTAPVPTAPSEPTAPTSDECPEGSKKSGKGKGDDSGKGKGSGSGKSMKMCKGGMMMGMETKTPKSPKTPKADEPKSTKAPKAEGDGKGKGDARRYLK
jgi:hypothetical protein